MRFIDLEALKPKVRDLIPPLEEAQAEVNAESDPALRAALMKKYRPRWVALREAFDEYSYGKCWYTESKNPGTDDDVDHFRPKGRLAEDDKHGGYYWLAFDWTNFRLSCHRANRLRSNPETGGLGGKADHFPLIDPAARAYVESDDIGNEKPALLDPTEILDVSMLTFDAAGDAALSPEYRGSQTAEQKLDESIRHLHLNWPKFREERLGIYHRVERLVDRGAKSAPSGLMQMGSVTDAFKSVLHDLQDLTSPENAYSRAARAYIELFSHEWWVRDIVLKVV